MEYVKVKGHDHFVRDPRTNAIINTNKSQYNEYLLQKNSKVKEQQKIQELEENVANMKDDLNEIKSLLRSLINGS
jgi:tetrahydromethanopterin S-methyltransferase subunit B